MNNALIIQKWIDEFDTNTSFLTGDKAELPGLQNVGSFVQVMSPNAQRRNLVLSFNQSSEKTKKETLGKAQLKNKMFGKTMNNLTIQEKLTDKLTN